MDQQTKDQKAEALLRAAKRAVSEMKTCLFDENQSIRDLQDAIDEFEKPMEDGDDVHT